MNYHSIKGFLQYIRNERRYSTHTVIAYENDLDQAAQYMSITYTHKELYHATFPQIRSWIVQLLEQKINTYTIKRKISTLKSYFKYCIKNELIVKNPMLKIISPKTAKRLPAFINENEMEKMLSQMDLGNNWEGMRDQLIIEILYATGMRRSELIHCKIQDIDSYNSQIKVLGKGNKERFIPIAKPLMKRIEGYIAMTNMKFSTQHEYLLVNDKGQKMSEKWVYNKVHFYLSTYSTIAKCSPHVLRHTFATLMLNEGADLNAIKEILGHANLSATQVYTHNNIEKLKSVHKLAHPRG